MSNNSLSNTKINITYTSLLHANSVPLPVTSQEDIYDGAGNKSSLKLGRACNGATVCGTFTCDTLSAGNLSTPGNLTISNASPYVNLIETDTSRSWFIVANNSSFDIRADSITGLRPFSIAYSTGNITLNNSLSVAGALSGASLTTTGNAIAATPTLSNHLTTKDYVDNTITLNEFIPVAKAYCTISGGILTVQASAGFTSITRTSGGRYTATFSSVRSNANYIVLLTRENTVREGEITVAPGSKTVNGFNIQNSNDDSSANDPYGFHVVVFK